MATTFTQAQGTVSASILSMGTLASATYIASTAQDLGVAIPLNKTLLVEATPNGAPTGNKQIVVFAQLSLDNSTFTSGPTSGTTTTDENQLHYIGVLPVTTSAQVSRRMMDLSNLPVARYVKLIAKNDCGVALSSGNIYWADITGTGT